MKNNWLTYKARDGVIETHMDYEFGLPAFQNFVRKGLKIASNYDSHKKKINKYRFLDTFFSDSINDVLFEEIVRKAHHESSEIQILLSDPYSKHAKIRARSINQNHELESAKGLKNILNALSRITTIEIHQDIENFKLLELIDYVQEQAETQNIEIRFYSEPPSGPMYFFKDLLLCGRFNAGKTSALLPWTMIVNHPEVKGDLYDLQLDEFKYLWENTKKNLYKEQ